jgi:hypothetical protein
MAQESHLPSDFDATQRVPATATLSEPTLRVPMSAPEAEAAATPNPDPAAEATMIVGQAAPRVAPPESSPLSVSAPRQLPLGVLPAGSILCDDCVLRETIRPHETTRPGLYLCDAPEGLVMVKIAAVEHPPRRELWERLPTLQHPTLLRTFRVQRERGFFAEVQTYCAGGTLDDCVPRAGKAPLSWENIEHGVVAPFMAGITYLHANGIVHRDIKPKNLYLRKNAGKVALVIGDFDISSVIESDNTSRDTPRGAGTHYYMAPEAFPRFVDPSAGRAAAIVSPASDFYSFGVVLVELLLGTTPLHSGRWSDVYDFYMAGGRLAIPAHLPARARQLLQGLLIRNRRTRWGVSEVRRWLDNQVNSADEQRIRDDAGFELVQRAARPYNVFSSAPADIPSLAQAMLAEPSLAEEELMSGDVLVNWLGELDAKLAREIRRDRETYRHFPRVAYLSALMRLDPTLPFPLAAGLTVASWDEWETTIAGYVRAKKLDLAAAVSRSTLMKLEMWLRLQSNPNVAAANAVADLRAAWWDGREGVLNPLDVRAAWEEMRWLRDPLRPFFITSRVSARTPAELAQLCYGHQADWQNGVPALYRAGLEKWRDGVLGAWLRQRARDENGVVSPVVAQIEALRHKNEFAPEPLWETVLRLLDPGLPLVRLRFVPGALGNGLSGEWGEIIFGRVSYEALSPGLPYGVWKLEDALDGLKFEPFEINQRYGELTLQLDTRNGFEPGSAGRAGIVLQPGGTCELEAPLSVYYRIKFPNARRNTFMRNGALIGAGLAGGSRLIAYLCTGPEWIPPEDRLAEPVPANPVAAAPVVDPVTGAVVTPLADTDTAVDELPPLGYMGAGIAMVLAGVIAFYIWLSALRRFAQR